MIKIEVSDETALAIGPFPFAFVRVLGALGGRKVWDGSKAVRFQANSGNIRLLKETDFPIEWIDLTGDLARAEELESLATQHTRAAPANVEYKPRIPPYKLQTEVLNLSWERKAYALLLEMGLGKTAVLIHNSGMLYKAKRVKGVLVFSPKGVHRQWINEEIPKHLDPSIKTNLFMWKGKFIELGAFREKGLNILSMNIDAVRTKTGYEMAQAFLKHHAGLNMMIIDESNSIGRLKERKGNNPSFNRTERALSLRALTTYRRIATGTPISKDLLDAWPQFMFLDPAILGQRYMSGFRARYCVLVPGDYGDRVVGQKNIEEFYRLIAPHSYRLTKDEALDLPPKIMIVREYEMSPETARHYKNMKNTLMTEMANGAIADAENAAVGMLRLHQIACGHVKDEDGKIHRFGGERIEAMMDIVRQSAGPIIIWARFTEDLDTITEALEAEGETWTRYRGTDDEREASKRDFLDGRKRVFVCNPSSGGVGLNLQGACQTVIYYSNSFQYLHRAQSEDRTHRMGMRGAITYYDLVAYRTVDRAILRNLKGKKDITELAFDTIRKAIGAEEDMAELP